MRSLVSKIGALIPVPILPAGVPFFVPSTQTVPNGVLECNGQVFSALSYPDLAKAYPSFSLPTMSGMQGGVAGKWYCYVSNQFYDMGVDGGNALSLGGHPPEYYASATALSSATDMEALAISSLPNHVIDGKKFLYSSGLTLGVTAGKSKVGSVVVEKAADSLTLQAKRLGIITENADGILSAQYAADPTTFVDANTVALWKPDGSASCPNLAVGVNGNTLAVANDLTKTGTVTAVDGIFGGNAAQGDGSTGYYAIANYTNFPSGAGERETSFLYTHKNSNSTVALMVVSSDGGVDNQSAWFGVANGVVQFATAASVYSSGYALTVDQTYLITYMYDGSTVYVLVNGSLVYYVAVVLNTVNATVNIFRNSNSTQYNNGIIHFVEIRNKMRTTQAIAEMAAKMLFPVCYDKTSAVYPTILASDQATAYHEWKFDETSGSAVTDTTGTLSGVATGTTIIDSPVGLGKARKFNGTVNDVITLGTMALSNAFTIISVFTQTPGSAYPNLFGNSNNFLGTSFNGDGKPYFNANSTSYSSGVVVPNNTPSFVAFAYNVGNAAFYVNSTSPIPMTATYNPTAGNAQIGCGGNSVAANSFCGNIDYLVIIPRALSQAEIAQYYNSLMGTGRKNITAQLPADTISLGMVRTGATGLLSYNDSDWQYGRREKAFLGNRRVFLGWKYFNVSGGGAAVLEWNNPFGSRKVRNYYVWSPDANGTNETDIIQRHFNGTQYGGVSLITSQSRRISVQVDAIGAVFFNGSWQTSGYIGCYAEVLEDD